MTNRKMSSEEVFVSAMNAAISGFMAANGAEIFDSSKQQQRMFGHRSHAINSIVAIVDLASLAGDSAVEKWNEFCEESEI